MLIWPSGATACRGWHAFAVVSPSPRLDRTREFARSEVARLLGIDQFTSDALFLLAAEVLGPERAERCLAIARLAPLTRRADATSAVAELVVGVRALGIGWWSQVHRELRYHGEWLDRGTPDQLLAQRDCPEIGREPPGSCLATLGYWIADDSADAVWGRPIGTVDLNDLDVDDRVVLPDRAAPGDRFVAAWDPGCRVDVGIVERDGPPDERSERAGRRRGRLGSELGGLHYAAAVDAGWAWSMATDIEPIRLPGEVAGNATDPFGVTLDLAVARRLYSWAADHEPSSELLGPAWQTKADAWSARFRLGLPYARPGSWFEFDRALCAAVDGDRDCLADQLVKLS